MFDHMSGVDGINRISREWKSTTHVEPHVSFLQWISIDIYETGKVLGSASQVKIEPMPIAAACSVGEPFYPIVRPGCFGNQKEIQILVALMKHILPQLRES